MNEENLKNILQAENGKDLLIYLQSILYEFDSIENVKIDPFHIFGSIIDLIAIKKAKKILMKKLEFLQGLETYEMERDPKDSYEV